VAENLSPKLIAWGSGFDEATLAQAKRTASLPIIYDYVALMPDAHLGKGATVGSVIATKNAIIPSAVGVDIGCGMIAARLNFKTDKLPDNLDRLLSAIEKAVPAGLGCENKKVAAKAMKFFDENKPQSLLAEKMLGKAIKQLGSLGSGNHFLELSKDENDDCWLVLHSGSRYIGKELAEAHITKAKELAKSLELNDPELAYFTQGTPEFEHYINDMLWAQKYAALNREIMLESALDTLFKFLRFGKVLETINCHHNFAAKETFGGIDLWITRKGAIKADKNMLGIIPGSMGTKSYITRGKGNLLSFNSSAHGAGRRYSRNKARALFGAADLKKQMGNKTWLKSQAVKLVDEIPSAYKDINEVMKAQSDLVEIVHELDQILNYKGI
jgi:RNA-splicing ligase RtcB